MSRSIIVDILGSSAAFQKSTEDAITASNKFGNVLQGIGQGIGQAAFGALQTGFGDVQSFISGAIDQADLLNKSIQKSGVVFGDSSAIIKNWANTTAESIGLGATAALDAADAVGNLFTSAGILQGKSADLSKSVVQLAADLGSFNNMSTDDALTKLEAGLTGSTKGLKSLQIVMTAQEVNQQAMKDGAVKVNGAFTDAALTLARYEVIMEKTTNAQGDFARNTGSVADAQARMNAELQNSQAELGQHFLPVQVAATNAQNDFFKGLGVVDAALGSFGQLLFATSNKYVDIFAPQTAIAVTAADNLAAALANTTESTGKLADDIGGPKLVAAIATQAAAMDGLAAHVHDVSSPALDKAARSMGSSMIISLNEGVAAALTAKPVLPKIIGNNVLEDQLKRNEGIWKVFEAAAHKAGDSTGVQAAITQIAAIQAEISALEADSGIPGGGGRASGGPVKKGVGYMVGELGPEPFIPDTNGTIIPHGALGAMGGGGGSNITLNISNYGINDPEAMARAIVLPLKRELSRQNISLA